MKILVTGGAGFIGSNVADGYVREGHDVIVVDDLSAGNRENINPKCKFYEADVSTEEFASIIEKERPDLINHHAAQIDVRLSVENPKFDARVNIMGMINLCEAAVKAKTRKVIFSSSGGVLYGEVLGAPAPESTPAFPVCPYGVGKYASEMYLRYFKEEFGLRYTILRYANVYGPRQKGGEAGVVAIFIRRMLEGRPTVIFDDGNQERDFVFVGDVVKANLYSLEKADGETMNIGTGKTATVNDVHRILAKLAGYKGAVSHEPRRPGELKRSVLSCELAARKLDWMPETTLEEGLKITYEWFAKK